MPLAIDVPRDPAKAITLPAPILHVEVQLGSLVARGRDGYEAEGRAGETIDGDKLRVPITLTATESPCRVGLIYDAQLQRDTA